jgi:hypothetical protein
VPPLAIQAFVPCSVYPSPSGTARVAAAARSDPAPGSDTANAPCTTPAAMPGRYRRRCSGDPCRMTGVADSAWMDSA